MNIRLLLLSSLLLSACIAEKENSIPQNEATSTSSSSEETEISDQQNKVLSAITEMQVEVPMHWNKSKPQFDGPYTMIIFTSPNYQYKQGDGMCNKTEGAEIVISAVNIQEKMGTIDDLLQRGEEFESDSNISEMKKVTVDNNPAAQYVWTHECSPRLITETDYDGIRYSIYLSDTEKLTQYSSQYHGIIDSIRFAKDNSH